MTTKYVPVKGHRGITKYQNADGKDVYRVQVYQGRDWQTGKRRYASQQPFTTLKAAVAWQAEQKDRVRRGELVEPSMLPFGQWAGQWLATLIDASHQSRNIYRTRIERVLPAIGQAPISRITPAMLDAAYAGLIEAGYSPTTVRSIHSTVSAILARAVEHSMILRNPATVARPPAARKHEQVTWTAEQLRHFLTVTADTPWSIVWRTMAETWIRVGELIDLRWGSVDLDGRTVTIERTITLGRDRKPVSNERGKTATARRTIPITAELADGLRHHRDKLRFLDRDTSATGLVFPAPTHGGWMVNASVAYALRAACLRAELPVLSPHGLRHTGGSIAYRAGIDVKTISERLGHATPSFTLAVYTHLNDDHHRAAADEIGKLLSG
jgi:integrase